MRHSILFVDDSESIGGIVKNILNHFGFDVTLAFNGESALESFKENGPFDLTVIDFHMPGMNGETVLKNLRKMDADVPVIILSGDNDINKAQELKKHFDIFQWAVKPIEANELKMICEEAIQSSYH